MSENTMITWAKEKSVPHCFKFQVSPKLEGKINRKGLWGSEGYGEMGARKLIFKSEGRANKTWTIYDGKTEKSLGEISFNWKDFQRSQLKLATGKIFYFRNYDFFRGVWSWIKEDSPIEQYIFRVDSPFQRSGTIESSSKELSAEERDILLPLGLHLQHFLNTWLMTIAIVVIMIVAG
ncbi:MAG: hypothetical protein K9N35_04400 [Candidatus Marinimicrobia bacterium]|nr:hypothetical protein [Candidatus Neomarinimicrobiota bacterium]